MSGGSDAPSLITPTRRALLDLAASGHRVPIGTHLILHEHPDHDDIQMDGKRLGSVIATAAERYASPLAMPLMDLAIEKECLLTTLGVPEPDIESYHFSTPPPEVGDFTITPKMLAACEAIQTVASRSGLLPMGMGIGPFSLMTKLVADPITPVFLAGSGLGPEDEPEVGVVERAIALGTELILRYTMMQVRAGARAIIVCEPAANLVYFSPNQLADSYEIFDRYVMKPMLRIKKAIEDAGAELVFHDCGELTPEMVSRFATLHAVMTSFGSSRCLWKDAALFPKTTVLYGNLPTKHFISPQLTSMEVGRMANDLAAKMNQAGHPFILGSECDVLSVPGQEESLMKKVLAFLPNR